MLINKKQLRIYDTNITSIILILEILFITRYLTTTDIYVIKFNIVTTHASSHNTSQLTRIIIIKLIIGICFKNISLFLKNFIRKYNINISTKGIGSNLIWI